MSRGMPSMVALLGLLAVAGYQNRDKIAEVMGAAASARGQSRPQRTAKSGRIARQAGRAARRCGCWQHTERWATRLGRSF